ncbi:YdaS family helix-turn-helix protein [uncultured Microbulbifer sp.]|uniref:YdaS family helix-turn-helix protein n=1 Tax=uncultured Microbulbifer sp. TaxID=348147 RepID=UPI00260A9A1A|nr:YdaS family helix-turn-helix protein [uncultured Microbulbifer sp.]
MNLIAYLKIKPCLKRREWLAKSIGCSVGHLNAIACGAEQPGPKLSMAIESATQGAVTREDCRPDIWGEDPLPTTNSSMEARQELVNQ